MCLERNKKMFCRYCFVPENYSTKVKTDLYEVLRDSGACNTRVRASGQSILAANRSAEFILDRVCLTKSILEYAVVSQISYRLKTLLGIFYVIHILQYYKSYITNHTKYSLISYCLRYLYSVIRLYQYQ